MNNEGALQKITLATVTPVYAGAEYLPQLVEKLDKLRAHWELTKFPLELTESVFVIDDAIDDSLDVLNKLQNQYQWISIINLSRNFGQHQATVAGLLHTVSDWVVTLDEDLQHDPDYIESLLRAITQKNLDICYAKPEDSVHQSRLRDWGSRVWKTIVASLTGNKHVRKFNSFRLIRGNLARAAASVCSHGTYFDIALCWFTNRITSIKLPLKDHRYIESNDSGYTLHKLFSHARRLIISSETKLLRLGAIIGLIAVIIASIFSFYILAHKLISPESILIRGWSSLILSSLFFSGLILMLTGIVLEYISVILLHIQGKPTFFEVDRRSDQILKQYFRNKNVTISAQEK